MPPEPITTRSEPAPVRFVVLATQRTGSSWFVDLLNGQPGVRACTEVYLDRPPRAKGDKLFWKALNPTQRYHEYRLERGLRRPVAPWKYLRFIEENDSVGHHAFGFKLMYAQLRLLPELLPCLCLRRYRFIHVVRDNPLDVVISRAAMKRGPAVHRHKDARATDAALDQPPPLAPGRAVRDVRWLLRKRKLAGLMLRSLPVPVLEVSYEQTRADPAGQLQRVLGWLGLPGQPPRVDSVFARVSPARQQDKVGNYQELSHAFHRAGLQRLLDP